MAHLLKLIPDEKSKTGIALSEYRRLWHKKERAWNITKKQQTRYKIISLELQLAVNDAFKVAEKEFPNINFDGGSITQDWIRNHGYGRSYFIIDII